MRFLIDTNQSFTRRGAMPVLAEVYEGTKNETCPVPLLGTGAERLIDRHAANGYAIISACRGAADSNLSGTPQERQELADVNAERMRRIVADVQEAGFSYTLSYGSFVENKGEKNEGRVYARGVIVYAEKSGRKACPEELVKFAIAECGKFNQDRVLVKTPDGNPEYVKPNGETDFSFEDAPTVNDVLRAYFADLYENTQRNGGPARVEFEESFIAPAPQCYSERHTRSLKGEIFLLK